MIDTLFKIIPGLEAPSYSLTTFFVRLYQQLHWFLFFFSLPEVKTVIVQEKTLTAELLALKNFPPRKGDFILCHHNTELGCSEDKATDSETNVM